MSLLLDGRYIPVFPLPDVVLYPRILLPLHVFEPRYRRLLSEVLDSHGRIGMGMIRPGRPSGRSRPQDIYPTMGVGQIATYQTRDNGTSDVFLLGEARARVVEWQEGEEYHRARLEVLEDSLPEEDGEKETLRKMLLEWFERVSPDRVEDEVRGKLQDLLAGQKDPGFMADFLAHLFLSAAGSRQVLLEETEVEVRIRRLGDALDSGD